MWILLRLGTHRIHPTPPLQPPKSKPRSTLNVKTPLDTKNNLFIYFCTAPFKIKAHSAALNAASFAHRFSNCPHTTKKKRKKRRCVSSRKNHAPRGGGGGGDPPLNTPLPLVTADVMPASLCERRQSRSPKRTGRRCVAANSAVAMATCPSCGAGLKSIMYY